MISNFSESIAVLALMSPSRNKTMEILFPDCILRFTVFFLNFFFTYYEFADSFNLSQFIMKRDQRILCHVKKLSYIQDFLRKDSIKFPM